MTRVLVVDDDPDIRLLIRYALVDEGYEVDEASDGQVALDLAGRRKPDIIVLDMRMPRMDGWEFSRLYRERHGALVPIIVLTAARDAALRAADIHAEGYIAKPFDLEELLELVSSTVRSAS